MRHVLTWVSIRVCQREPGHAVLDLRIRTEGLYIDSEYVERV